MVYTLILHRNRIKLLYLCLKSIVKSDYEGNIIVIDSSDVGHKPRYDIDNIQYYDVQFEGVFIRSKHLNQVAKTLKPDDIISFIDCDIIVPKTYGTIINNITNYDRVAFYIKDRYFAFDDWAMQSGTMPVGNSNFAIRQGDYFAVGGLDERFRGRGYEDQDLMDRLNKYFIITKGKLNNYASFKEEDTFIHIPHEYEKDWKTEEIENANNRIFAENQWVNRIIVNQ